MCISCRNSYFRFLYYVSHVYVRTRYLRYQQQPRNRYNIYHHKIIRLWPRFKDGMETSSIYHISDINIDFTSDSFSLFSSWALPSNVWGSHPTLCHLRRAQWSSIVYHEMTKTARLVNKSPLPRLYGKGRFIRTRSSQQPASAPFPAPREYTPQPHAVFLSNIAVQWGHLRIPNILGWNLGAETG
jgi:hypothetical protein